MENNPSLPVYILNTLGETAISVAVKGVKDFVQFLILTLKLLWDKTLIFRTKVFNAAKYLFIFVASPFVKMSLNFDNMRADLRQKREQFGTAEAVKAFFPYFARFVFGRRGLGVTMFNYAAPVISFVFLFNVVSYATSANFSLRLVVNNEFLGYIENEQVFLDAESLVLQRVNYFGSDSVIEINPQFSVANSSDSEHLTAPQVANMILDRSDFEMEYAYGFFIDDVCYGAIKENDIGEIRSTVDKLLNKYRSKNSGIEEEVAFLNDVVWEQYDRFLVESIVEPNEIITMITAERDGEPYLPVVVTRVEEYDEKVKFDIEHVPDESYYQNASFTKQQGEDGVSRITARATYLNGEEIQRVVIESRVVTQPVTQIVHIGTKPHADGVVSTQDATEMFIWPVVNTNGEPVGGVTNGYGYGHGALDIAGGGLFGTPIVAAGNGTVIQAGVLGDYGNCITIQHDNGMRTLYSHNNVNLVKVGQQVTMGDQIATLGETGRAFGAHLHFEVIAAGSHRRLNPWEYLPKR